ncbi:MAG TPA: hypothetical protein VG755_33755 [Nannocystaceae bacterium]|nr:hypothetical protein [Nannocystaceae bacterium]
MSWTRCAVAALLIAACGSKDDASASASSESSSSSAAVDSSGDDTGPPSCVDGIDFEARFYGSDISGVIEAMPCMVDAIEDAEDATTRLLSIGLTCEAAQGFVSIAIEKGLLDAAGLTLAIELAAGDAVVFDRFFEPGTGTDHEHDWTSLRRDDGTLVAAGIHGSHLADAPAGALAMVSPLVASAMDPCPSAEPPAACAPWHDGIAVTLDGASNTLVAGQAPKLGAFRVVVGRATRHDVPAEGCDPVDGVDVAAALYQLVAWREP